MLIRSSQLIQQIGTSWDYDGRKIYVDAALSFGLRSAPKIFTALAYAATWGLRSLGIRYIDHYLDDWITIGSPVSSECEKNCALMAVTFDRPAVTHWSTTACCYGGEARTHIYETDVRPFEVIQ